MTTTTPPPDDPALARRKQRQAYTTWIEYISRDDPGARSALRSGVRRGINEVPRMHRLVAPWLPRNRQASDQEQQAYYAVAAMIADQPRSSHASDADTQPAVGTAAVRRYGTSLGTAFALAITQSPGREREMRETTAERRLNLLTRQSTSGLHRHLPASLRYLRDLNVPVDWAQLLDDLIAWPVYSGQISRRWLQDYYRLRTKADQNKADAADQQDLTAPDQPGA